MPTRSLPTRRRSALIVGLLLLALLLTASLAYQAQAAARSHRQTAERALRDYAAFAAWEYSQRARVLLLTTLVSAFGGPVARINPDSIEETAPGVQRFGLDARRWTMWCDGCLDSVQFYFRYRWRDGSFTTSQPPATPWLGTWVRDTIVAHARAFAPRTGFRPLTGGSMRGRERMELFVSNDSYATLVADVAGASRLVSYVLVRDLRGAPIYSYGFVSPPRPFLGALLDSLYRSETLLPPSLLRNVADDSVLAISVTDPHGHSLYESPQPFRATFSATDSLGGPLGGIIVHAALNPQMAERLVVGGLPRSRLPALLGIFVLAAGLVVVALHQLRRQQELAQLRADFVSGVSHELRTPLAQIRVFAELLHMGRLRTDEERRRSARIIDQEARRLTYLVENVLSFSRSEHGRGLVSPQPANVGREVREAVELFAPLAAARQATLRWTAAHGLVAEVDRSAFRQVLLNLLDNAVKYGPAGQTVRVDASAQGDKILVSVSDEGPGIPPEHRELVWEPYQRLDREVESSVGGSGIGLAVVREVVRLHHGRAWVEAAASGGARFVIELPRAHDVPPSDLTTTAEIPIGNVTV